MEKRTSDIALFEYYGTPGARKLCHLAKKGDAGAINMMARHMAASLPDDIYVIPVPNASGTAEYTLRLAKEISRANPTIRVMDVMRGKSRMPQYVAKKKGIDIDFGFRKKIARTKVPDNAYLIANVVATGRTMMKLREAIGKNLPVLAFAVDRTACRYGRELRKNCFPGGPLPDSIVKRRVRLR